MSGIGRWNSAEHCDPGVAKDGFPPSAIATLCSDPKRRPGSAAPATGSAAPPTRWADFRVRVRTPGVACYDRIRIRGDVFADGRPAHQPDRAGAADRGEPGPDHCRGHAPHDRPRPAQHRGLRGHAGRHHAGRWPAHDLPAGQGRLLDAVRVDHRPGRRADRVRPRLPHDGLSAVAQPVEDRSPVAQVDAKDGRGRLHSGRRARLVIDQLRAALVGHPEDPQVGRTGQSGGRSPGLLRAAGAVHGGDTDLSSTSCVARGPRCGWAASRAG